MKLKNGTRTPATDNGRGVRRSKPASRPDRQITYARVLGLVLAAAGFVMIGLGWAGAARRTCVDCQIPYIISGGAAGVALVVFGAALLLMAQVRAEGLRLASRMQPAAGKATGGPSTDSTGIMRVEGATHPAELEADSA